MNTKQKSSIPCRNLVALLVALAGIIFVPPVLAGINFAGMPGGYGNADGT